MNLVKTPFDAISLLLKESSIWHQVALPGLLLFVIYFTYCYITNPLNKLPGPFLSKFSSLWFVRKTYQRQRHFFDVDLHRKYGPVVRVGPTEVSLSSPVALKAVYGML